MLRPRSWSSGAATSGSDFSAGRSLRDGLFAEARLARRAGLLGLTKGIAGILGRTGGRTNAADAGGCGLAGLHGRITAAMRRLSATGNAIVRCLNGRRCHGQKRECEQRRGRGGQRLRSRFHLFFFLFSQVGRNRPQTPPPCRDHAAVDGFSRMRRASFRNRG